MDGARRFGDADAVHPEALRVLALQAGVVSRRQALACGLAPHVVRRLLRRREWVVLHPGVYVAHTGEPTWLQRAWGAVLLTSPSALWGESALRAADGPGRIPSDPKTIHVAVDRRRSSLVTPGEVKVHHVSGLLEKALWNVGPPRMRYEEAALDVAITARSDLDAVAALARACQVRRTTPERLLRSLDERPRVTGRTWLEGVLRDVADGTCSVLEHGFVTRVERPHGLPRARRQVRARASVGVVYRDAVFGERDLVELDGALFHDSATARDADFERDLDAAAEGKATVRLSYGQVFARPCSTASKLARILLAHGLAFRPRRCGPQCPVAAVRAVG
jgi:hypothetical protein